MKHALQRGGLDPAIAELDPEELIPGEGGAGADAAGAGT